MPQNSLFYHLYSKLGLIDRRRLQRSLANSLLPNLLENVIAPKSREVEPLVALKRGQRTIRILGQALDLEIRRNARRRHTLGQNDCAALNSPAGQQWARIHTQLSRHRVHQRVINRPWLTRLVVPERRIRLNHDTLALAELEKIGLLEVWVGFDLVGGRNNRHLAEELLQSADVEVGDPNRAHFPGRQKLLHSLVGGDVVHIGELEHAVVVQGEPLVAGFECTVRGSLVPFGESSKLKVLTMASA